VAKGKKPTASAELRRLEEIKKLVVIAMFSDNELMDRLVLKGGNALDLIHRISTRASIDVDFSMEDDFPAGQREGFRGRMQRALKETFREAQYEVFDVKMEERPEGLTPDMADFWGGYAVEFKLIEKSKYEQFSASMEDLRRNAIPLGQGQKFLIDISRFEYTAGKEMQKLDGYRVFVYSAEMMVCEKLRAICQQMPQYGPVVKRKRPGSARARDFLDIHTLVTQRGLDLASEKIRQLLAQVFAAKRVPLSLLAHIQDYRELHRTDFPAVMATIKPGAKVREFDFYFDFVLSLVEQLEPLRDV
jgi:hypothetical protein